MMNDYRFIDDIDENDGENMRNRSSIASCVALNKSSHLVEASLKPLNSHFDMTNRVTISHIR